MWNHAQNSTPSGEEDTNDADQNTGLKDRVEKSLDLTQYLKYLEQLFSRAISESESSDSDDGERSHSFNDFLQPPAQHSDRSQTQFNQNHVGIGCSNVAESNHVIALSSLKSENFHLEANISSSSLSSIDSGTSSLSINLSSDNGTEATIKIEEGTVRENNRVSKSPNLCTDSSNNSTIGPEDDKGSEKNSEKEKKPQKKKKASRNNSESLPRQHKPSSGGKGNGSRGGGGGGLATGGGSNGGSSGSGGSSSSANQGLGGSTSSPGAKSRSGKQSLQQSNTDAISSFASGTKYDNSCGKNSTSAIAAGILLSCPSSEGNISSLLGSSDVQFMDGDEGLTDSFASELLATSSESVDTYESNHGMQPFPLTAILDMHDEETNISDYISMETAAVSSISHPSPFPQSSTNFFSKIAASAASTAFSNSRNNSTSQGGQCLKDIAKLDARKRRLDGSSLKLASNKVAKLTEKQKQTRIEQLNARRRKIYVYICKKEVGKTQRTRANTFKENLVMKRKLAHACARHLRKKALQSQKCMKDSVCKAKRLTQEMEVYWKQVNRAEREFIRKKEKEAEDKYRKDKEILNHKLQGRNLNRLVTQIELFTVKLLNLANLGNIEHDILLKLDELKDDRIAHLDDYDSAIVKSHVQGNVDRALKEHQNLVQLLDMSDTYFPDTSQSQDTFCKGIAQPHMFQGVLKTYQHRGMSWIKKLYTMGLNGILADETGLGKKVQVVAFLSHLAESCGLWGPFLVVCPTSSLSRWQEKFDKISPRLKVVSYWGKPMERKILRQFWERSCLHKEEASFHVVVTSYQVMVSDLKYFSKIKWQYLVMDDSQGAITSSTKWMPLLSFRCRNKLLLSSNLRLNSLSHLCSYLYFIMPSLFDSQEEFSEWLLKELESPTVDIKKEIDQSILSRLQTVAQKFLLQRGKTDVDHEMASNIDMQLNCSLSRRQRRIYNALLGKTDLRDVLLGLETCKPEEIRSRKMKVLNLSVQLRKSCNHPNLVEKRNFCSPMWMEAIELLFPKLIYQITDSICGEHQELKHPFNIYLAYNIHTSLFGEKLEKSSVTKTVGKLSTWSFVRMLAMSCGEVEKIYSEGIFARLMHLVNFQSVLEKVHYNMYWRNRQEIEDFIDYRDVILWYSLRQSKVLSKLVYTSISSSIYTWENVKVFSSPETVVHRSLCSRTAFADHYGPGNRRQNFDARVRQLQPLKYPTLFQCIYPKVKAEGCKSIVTCKKLRQENRYCLPQLHFKEASKLEGLSLIWESILQLGRTQIVTPEHDQWISDSGKLRVLDGLLTKLWRNRNRVLICSCIPETLEILEEFLIIRRWKFARLGDRHIKNTVSDTDVFVYLISTQCRVTDIRNFMIDTVIFYDQDWDTNIEDQKARIIIKLELSNPVNCYSLICPGTIEERILRLTKERNVVSLALCKDVLESKRMSSVPSLKSLVSVLKSETITDRRLIKFETVPKNVLPKERLMSDPLPVKSDNQKFDMDDQNMKAFTKDAGAVYEMDLLGYVNSTEGSDSASPSYSEELDHEDIDDDVDVKGIQDDNFNYSFDEGYMGMSPDSFEEVLIKSDYEEDSSPLKPKIGRGTGKRGRPPSRILYQMRNLNDGSSNRRGPGRPRLKPIGPSNQGTRGRKPGRPPLTKKAETISSNLAPLSSGQRVFGFYSSPDLELS